MPDLYQLRCGHFGRRHYEGRGENGKVKAHARYVGGMVGNLAAEHATVVNCVNNGELVINNASDATNVGGIAGNASKKKQKFETE